MTWTAQDVSAISISFGPYFDLFSQRFFDTTEALNPRPVKIVLVTDVDRDVPDWIEQHTLGEGLPLYAYYNEAVKYVESEWTWGCGFDDWMEVDAFHDFQSDADCHGHPEKMGDGSGAICSYGGGYSEMPLGGPNQMLGSYFHRTALLREMPWREHDFADWTHFSEMAFFGKTVSFEDRCIATWARHEKSASLQYNPSGIEQVWQHHRDLAEGRIAFPGAPVAEVAVEVG